MYHLTKSYKAKHPRNHRPGPGIKHFQHPKSPPCVPSHPQPPSLPREMTTNLTFMVLISLLLLMPMHASLTTTLFHQVLNFT